MKAPLILVAASGLAREALQAARAQSAYDVEGLVDDNPAMWGTILDGVTVLGGLDTVDDHPDSLLLVCAGRGAARESIVSRLGVETCRYATVVDPTALVPTSCTVGAGSILLASCVLTANVTVGKHVVAMPNVTLTHDDVIDDFATLCANVTLGGTVRIGQRAYLGMAASIREGCHIGDDAVVGMGAVVLQSVPPGETCFGVPAKKAVRTGTTPRLR